MNAYGYRSNARTPFTPMRRRLEEFTQSRLRYLHLQLDGAFTQGHKADELVACRMSRLGSRVLAQLSDTELSVNQPMRG